MRFDKPESVDMICYDLKLADYPRGMNRARINDLFNGAPPYSGEEVAENNIAVNVNDLTSARLGHDARMQFYNAIQKPGRFFKASTDMGQRDKREARAMTVTAELNRPMKREIRYFECLRSKFALDVLHGIGPSYWDTEDFWCPDALGVEDILVPARTLLTMKNLPYVAFYRNYTHNMLRRITRAKENPGWNMPMVEKAIEWIETETAALAGSTWPEVRSPEKRTEAAKEDGGLYGADRVPTVDVFDFWFWSDEGGEEGWSRRIILDTWGTPTTKGTGYAMTANGNRSFGKNQFLYDSGSRKVARTWQNIFSVQFADLSAVAPFRWHSVRSLGWLLYAPCHMLNRQRCKVAEAVFRDLMLMMRVKDQADAQRALQVNLVDRGFVDETISFLKADERYQVNTGLVEFGMNHQKESIEASAGLFTQTKNYSDRTEKTKFQVMAELNATMNLVSAAFNQAYEYQKFEYEEIKRRLMLTDTRDPDAKTFRARCLSKGVPEKMLVPEAWELEPERIMGGGNKTMELAIAEQLMAFRPQYDPDSQRKILRDVTYAITDDPARAEDLVPDQPLKVTDSVHDAQLTAGALMQGLPVAPRTGQNHTEVIATLLVDLELLIGAANQQGGMMAPDKLQGCMRIVAYTQEHLKFLAQDKESKPTVAAFEKKLGKLVNELRAFGQRLDEAQKKAQEQQQGGNGQMPPEQMAKIQGEKIKADAKVQTARESHGARTAQKNLSWELEEKRKQEAFEAEQRRLDAQTQADIVREGAVASEEMQTNRLKGMEGDE